MPKIKPRSSRRAPPLKDSDYDHEIALVDNSDEVGRARSKSAGSDSVAPPRPSTTEPFIHQESGSSAGAGTSGQAEPEEQQLSSGTEPVVKVQEPTPLEHPTERNGSRHKKPHREQAESAIDILYENERGGFLCGIPLFSSKALGNLDPPAWTNFAHRPSPTNIRTAQVPDPSWEWAWPEWKINHDEGDDEGGWEYSFMFAKKFSWHRARWYNSFVRRRAWIRKRVKKADRQEGDADLLTPEYFTVQSAEVRRSQSRSSTKRGSKASISVASQAGTEIEEEKPDIEDMDSLLRTLRGARIDREKIDAIDNFLEHGDEELVHLQDEMHDIMALFVFQTSRKVLLTRLGQVYEEAVEQRKKEKKKNPEEKDSRLEQRAEYLAAAIRHGEEEVRRLEYWSDVKVIADSGATNTAVDPEHGWEERSWQGLDKSGPAGPDTPPPSKAASWKA